MATQDEILSKLALTLQRLFRSGNERLGAQATPEYRSQ